MGRLRAAPDISSRGSFLKVKVIEVKGQISESRQSLVRSSPNLEGRWRAAPDISLRVSFFERSRSSSGSFLKVNAIEVKGKISVSRQSLVRSSPNLEGRWRAAPDISLRGSFFERLRSSRLKVKFLYLGSPWSDLHETW